MFSSSKATHAILSAKLCFIIVLLCCTCRCVHGAVPDDELQALKDIAVSLNKTGWNYTADPCTDWGTDTDNNNVTCNCTISGDSVCHVVRIILKRQSLPGTLPSTALLRLPYLQEFDVTGNYLNGTIPSEWGSMAYLEKISVMANRLTGSIPIEIGNISTLTSFVVESNELSGVVPTELGNLKQLQRLYLNSNNFTGPLPESFANLTSLTEMWLSDNQFNGTIPNFIQNWTNLNQLVIQGSGLQGPIPIGIVELKNLTDLRISDLSGSGAEFPQLGSTQMEQLVLRNCNFIGELPDYLGTMTISQTLDISFNQLIGKIPSSFNNLTTISYMYLTNNQFTGPMPDWFFNTTKLIDLSYNNFTINASTCPRDSVNLFKSTPESNNIGEVTCLGGMQCQETSNRLHINCGGQVVTTDDGIEYASDEDQGSPSKFYDDNKNNWVYSSTGQFLDSSAKTTYIVLNKSVLSIKNPELYMNARISPITLTYYAYCLDNGTYTVSLHFVEIMFTNGEDYQSLGRRIFDVYIQEKLVLQDFNIVEEANGAGQLVIRNFTNIVVTNKTLEIRLTWSGKGTRALPVNGVYGPLISAISIVSDNISEEDSGNGNSISSGLVVSIVASTASIIFLILGVLYWRGCLGHDPTLEQELKGIDLQTSSFSLRQIKDATNNFDVANKIGEGGFGTVYKGILSDGTTIAVKQLSSKSKQGNREFVNEIGMISALQHPHLVKLFGCCIDGNQLLLVYEYMDNNSLARALFGRREHHLNLNWLTRYNICVGIARGLTYLHEESRLKIVHRDIKATNVLLDKSLNAKISDFGLAKLDEEDNTHISTRVAGTYGYIAPEYALHGHLTEKADVYSFGIVALEIVSGQSNISRQKDECFLLLDWARVLKVRGKLMELVDPRLGSDINKEQVAVMINVALQCTSGSPSNRPTMSSVVSMLEGKIGVPQILLDSTDVVVDATRIEFMRKHFGGSKVDEHEKVIENMAMSNQTNESMTHGTQSQSDAPWTGSSASTTDLYPLMLHSFKWQSSE